MKRLGIIGGVGPMATAYFLQLLTQMSDADIDQRHMEIYMISKPTIPDRTDYILGVSSKSPAIEMAGVGKQLKLLGAELLAIPCITGHYFHRELEQRTGLPIINAVNETVDYLRGRKASRVGIMATDGTIKSRLFQDIMDEFGIESLVPEQEEQKAVMDIIYKDIKAGKPANQEKFQEVSKQLRRRGAEVILLACTELSVPKRDHQIGKGYLDVMDVMAAKAVASCNQLKKEYRELIT